MLTLAVVVTASLFVAVFILAMRREMRAFYQRARIAYARDTGRRG